MIAAILRTTGEVEELDRTDYEALRDAVGGYIEYLPTRTGDGLYVNEEGLIHNLPPNHLATFFADRPWPLLVGDAVLVGPLDDDGEHLPVSYDGLEYLNTIRIPG